MTDNDECEIEDDGVIAGKLTEWKEWIQNPSTQEEYDERMKLLSLLG